MNTDDLNDLGYPVVDVASLPEAVDGDDADTADRDGGLS